MRKILILGALLAGLAGAHAQYAQPYGRGSGYGTGSNPSNTYVKPYIRNNGTAVGGHYRTAPNNNRLDNYGTKPNVNPYTGKIGTKSPNGW